jgi:hypothetical protein
MAKTSSSTRDLIILVCVAVLLVVLYKLCAAKKENFRDPYFLNRQKYNCDIYPRANGTIYTNYSNVLTGFPFYDKAY